MLFDRRKLGIRGNDMLVANAMKASEDGTLFTPDLDKVGEVKAAIMTCITMTRPFIPHNAVQCGCGCGYDIPVPGQ